jgi:hypothetical protein
MPEKSDAVVALGNITDAETIAIVTFGDGHSRTVRLAAHATENRKIAGLAPVLMLALRRV